jgi:hypothetical protein
MVGFVPLNSQFHVVNNRTSVSDQLTHTYTYSYESPNIVAYATVDFGTSTGKTKGVSAWTQSLALGEGLQSLIQEFFIQNNIDQNKFASGANLSVQIYEHPIRIDWKIGKPSRRQIFEKEYIE